MPISAWMPTEMRVLVIDEAITFSQESPKFKGRETKKSAIL